MRPEQRWRRSDAGERQKQGRSWRKWWPPYEELGRVGRWGGESGSGCSVWRRDEKEDRSPYSQAGTYEKIPE